jgi:uncharacterized protein
MTELSPSLSFRDVPVVDNHCHAFVPIDTGTDPSRWRAFFSESREQVMFEHAATMTSYQRIVVALAEFLGCEPHEEAVLEARERFGSREMIGALLRDANVDALLIDRGFPPADEVIPDTEIAAVSDVRVESFLRLEPLMEELLETAATLEEAKLALAERLTDLRGGGYVGLKSVAAYRTGLDLEVEEDPQAEMAFLDAKQAYQRAGSYRLASRPLLGALLLVAFRSAHEQELPLQFHVGYGDSDVDLMRSNPLNLRALLESHRFDGMKVVLLHECYPYTREGAYLAAIYGNVYLDLSYGIPFLGFSEMLSCTAAAVAVAPTSKLLYSSDGLGVPELHWSSAHRGREVLELVMRECVERNELTAEQALLAGRNILRDNAWRLYELA